MDGIAKGLVCVCSVCVLGKEGRKGRVQVLKMIFRSLGFIFMYM